MRTIYCTFSALFFTLAIVASGCKKEKEEDYDTQSCQDNAQAENIFNEINEISDQAVEDGQLSTHRLASGDFHWLSSCAIITLPFDSMNGSGTATIDFGSHFCQGNDTKYRKGLINVSYNGAYKNQGTEITINAVDYFVGYDSLFATKVNGQRIVSNNGINGSGHLNFSVQDNATLVNYLNQQMSWNSARNREWTAGDSTITRLDDEYIITGSAGGKSFAGVNFSSAITQPLHVRLNCRWITEGKFTLSPESKQERILDYGYGSCDGDATVTIGDKTYNLTLR